MNQLKRRKPHSQRYARVADTVWYIWNYYKVALILVCVGVLLLATAAKAIYQGMKENTLYVCFVNETQISDSQIRDLNDHYREYADISSPMNEISFDYSMDLMDTAYRSASLMKLSALLDMGQVHLIVAPAEVLTLLSGQNLFADARSFLSGDRSSSLSSRYCYDRDAEGNTVPVGITLDGTPLAQELNLKEDSLLLFVSQGENEEAVNQFIAYSLGL